MNKHLFLIFINLSNLLTFATPPTSVSDEVNPMIRYGGNFRGIHFWTVEMPTVDISAKFLLTQDLENWEHVPTASHPTIKKSRFFEGKTELYLNPGGPDQFFQAVQDPCRSDYFAGMTFESDQTIGGTGVYDMETSLIMFGCYGDNTPDIFAVRGLTGGRFFDTLDDYRTDRVIDYVAPLFGPNGDLRSRFVRETDKEIDSAGNLISPEESVCHLE